MLVGIDAHGRNISEAAAQRILGVKKPLRPSTTAPRKQRRVAGAHLKAFTSQNMTVLRFRHTLGIRADPNIHLLVSYNHTLKKLGKPTNLLLFKSSHVSPPKPKFQDSVSMCKVATEVQVARQRQPSYWFSSSRPTRSRWALVFGFPEQFSTISGNLMSFEFFSSKFGVQ